MNIILTANMPATGTGSVLMMAVANIDGTETDGQPLVWDKGNKTFKPSAVTAFDPASPGTIGGTVAGDVNARLLYIKGAFSGTPTSLIRVERASDHISALDLSNAGVLTVYGGVICDQPFKGSSGGTTYLYFESNGNMVITAQTAGKGLVIAGASAGTAKLVLDAPTSDPHVVNQIWNNLGIPTFSAG